MPHGQVAHTHMPYSMQRLEDGSWIVLNRDYEPLGVVGGLGAVDYATSHGRLKIDGRSIKAIANAALRVDFDAPRAEPTRMWFYDDGCVPTSGAEHLRAYNTRIEPLLLARATAAE